MNITPELEKLLKFTDEDVARGTLMIQGQPRCGKTALAQRIIEAMVGPNETFILDWPEEEGLGTLADRHVPYETMLSQGDLDVWYPRVVKMAPKGLIWDGLASSYWLLMKERVPSGIPPEDHGKTWMAVATALRREIVRFKLIPSVEAFIITSLVWPDKDELAAGELRRLQVTIPGQLKSNIYGLFSYNLLIELEDQANGESVRVLKAKPTSRFVAGVRAPVGNKVPAKIPYDLSKPGDAAMIVEKLGLKPFVAVEKEVSDGTRDIRSTTGSQKSSDGPTEAGRGGLDKPTVGENAPPTEGGGTEGSDKHPVRLLPRARAR